MKQACVWEIWDKRAMEAIWIAEGFNEKPLDVQDDPLNLERFFPCPAPLYATLTSDSLMPVPDFVQLQDQCAELDDITDSLSA